MMPFRYVIKWRRTHPEKVSVEAYYRYPQTEEEKRKPAFIIGKADGGGLLAIRHVLERAAEDNPTKKRRNTTHIFFDENKGTAHETVYRIGLATALINEAKTLQEIDKGTKYILNATPEEIWFWTSKWLDDEINARALEALAVLSGGKEITKQAAGPRKKGKFWPVIRQKMKEKAKQLYLQEHPYEKTEPPLRELRKQGYLQRAKSIVLREVYLERRKLSDQDYPQD